MWDVAALTKQRALAAAGVIHSFVWKSESCGHVEVSYAVKRLLCVWPMCLCVCWKFCQWIHYWRNWLLTSCGVYIVYDRKDSDCIDVVVMCHCGIQRAQTNPQTQLDCDVTWFASITRVLHYCYLIKYLRTITMQIALQSRINANGWLSLTLALYLCQSSQPTPRPSPPPFRPSCFCFDTINPPTKMPRGGRRHHTAPRYDARCACVRLAHGLADADNRADILYIYIFAL